VSDGFHASSRGSILWEFKHRKGRFKRGDLVGLQKIKRRASRHKLTNRNSFSGPNSDTDSTPGTPGEQSTGSVEARFIGIEQMLLDVTTRLARTEDNNTYLSARCQAAVAGFAQCHQVRSPALSRLGSVSLS